MLRRDKDFKVILMSATLCSSTYSKYFDEFDVSPPIHVGVSRFENTYYHLNDLIEMDDSRLNELCNRDFVRLNQMMQRENPQDPVKDKKVLLLQIDLAFKIARCVGQPRETVLVFVPGIFALSELAAKFEILKETSSISYRVLCVHSSIPFSDQLAIFAQDDECVKICIATNAAESSLTIPDCNNVICLGLEKRVLYSPKRHRVELVERWISKASSTQRAGRTGRLRRGTVWRLYNQDFFHRMDDYPPPEMYSIPLDTILLNLASQFKCDMNQKGDTDTETRVRRVLEQVIDPPSPTNISRAFESLHENNFMDQHGITDFGIVASSLGVDLKLAQLIIYGYMCKVTPEAVAIAAALSLSNLPFRRASQFVHSDAEISEIVRNVHNGFKYVVFDRHVQYIHLFTLLLCHSNYKKIT